MITPTVVFAGLIGAIAWNLITWYFGLPSSSSHALIGGVVGSAVAAAGFDAVLADGLVGKVLIPAVIAPILAFVVAGDRDRARLPDRRHGSGPALVTPRLPLRADHLRRPAGARPRHQRRAEDDGRDHPGPGRQRHASAANADPPLWVIVSSATAIALGTYSGGWRIIRTTGTRIIKMDAAQGFSAQGAGAAVILASTHFGFPLSTTHVINGGVMGAGAGKRVSAVRWGVAGNIVVAWLLTLPAAAAIGALAYGVTAIFGSGALGPVLVTLMSLSLIVARSSRGARASGAAGPGELSRWRVVVETKELLQTVVASFVGGVGVTVDLLGGDLGGRPLRRPQPQRTAACRGRGGGRWRRLAAGGDPGGGRLRHHRDDQQVSCARAYEFAAVRTAAQRRDHHAAWRWSSPSRPAGATPPTPS